MTDGRIGRPTDRLTPRQRAIVELVANGKSNREIGAALGVTEYGIRNRLRDIFDVTGMSTRLELSLWWLEKITPAFEEGQPALYVAGRRYGVSYLELPDNPITHECGPDCICRVGMKKHVCGPDCPCMSLRRIESMKRNRSFRRLTNGLSYPENNDPELQVLGQEDIAPNVA